AGHDGVAHDRRPRPRTRNAGRRARPHHLLQADGGPGRRRFPHPGEGIMRKAAPRRLDLTSLIGVPFALGAVLLAQALEGGHARSLWQPSAALIVFGGTLGAVIISFSLRTVFRTIWAVATSFFSAAEPVEKIVKRLVNFAVDSRRRGLSSLEHELER